MSTFPDTDSAGSVYERLVDRCKTYAAHPFLHVPAEAAKTYSDTAVNYSYADALATTNGLISAYQRQGVQAGDMVALMMENRAEFFLHFMALNALGACIVPVSADLRDPEISYLLAKSEVGRWTVLPTLADRARALLVDLDLPITLLLSADLEAHVAGLLPDLPPANPDAAAAILFTSGTTGDPKGCILSNFYFLNTGDWYRVLGGICHLEPGCERLLTPLPVNHTNALCFSFMGMMTTGGCVIQLDRFHASTWWQTVRESNATALHYLGVMPAILMLRDPTENDDFSGQIKYGFGAGVNPEDHAAFEARFGFPLVEGWAMTETGGAACTMVVDAPRHVGARCIGRKQPFMDFRIVDDQGRDVPPGEPGEYLVRAAADDPARGFFSGYFKDAEATATAWRDGWFLTGDVVRQGPDGSLFFMERKKNIIRRSGENIAAAEVEAVLSRLPGVRNAVAAPVHDPVRGEEVFALILPGENMTPDEASAIGLLERSAEHLVYFKTPGYIAFVSELPVTGTQKIQRREVRNLVDSLMSANTYFDLRQQKSGLTRKA